MSIPEYPITPTEQYLAVMLGENVTLPDHPVTREHQYLAALAGLTGGSAKKPAGTALTLAPGRTYDFGEAAELELTVSADGHYHFAFLSPAGAPTVLTVTGHTAECGGNDTIEAGRRYECDIWAGVLLLKAMDTAVVSLP